MRTSDFDYELPEELIAQSPAEPRDHSRLLAFERSSGSIRHARFYELGQFLHPGDLLVLNDSRVIPARLFAEKTATGARVEIFLLEEKAANQWRALLRPAKRLRVGALLEALTPEGVRSGIQARLAEKEADGQGQVEFFGTKSILSDLDRLGATPLPPYIRRPPMANGREDRERYQTVFARAPGSVAAPTAGLHFTHALLARLREEGIRSAAVTLHVGLGTFAPVKTERVEEHAVHQERFEVSAAAAAAIRQTRARGRKIVAVGTTSVRVLEAVAREHGGEVAAAQGRTSLFVYPPFRFQVVDALLTNFHLPRSSLLMLASAFAAPGEPGGIERMRRVYAEAARERYRFYSYGDAMLIL